jgi:hypothetical protein
MGSQARFVRTQPGISMLLGFQIQMSLEFTVEVVFAFPAFPPPHINPPQLAP